MARDACSDPAPAAGPGRRLRSVPRFAGLALIAASMGAAALAAAPRRGEDGDSRWVESSGEEPAGTKYRTFRSKAVGGDVSYLVYLPPGYDADGDRRYPVVYWLHGLGDDQRGGAVFVERLDEAIRRGQAPAMIAVLVNAPKASMFVDAPDGKTPAATMIVEDLVRHVDATYRTQARRESRAVEGFSMGGFGAAHLGFKYPEVFGVVSILAGSLHRAEALVKEFPEAFEAAFGGDEDYARETSPWTLLEANADAIRGRTRIRIWVGERDAAYDGDEDYHRRLTRLGIEHEFRSFEGVGHDYHKLYEEAAPDERFALYAKAFRSTDE